MKGCSLINGDAIFLVLLVLTIGIRPRVLNADEGVPQCTDSICIPTLCQKTCDNFRGEAAIGSCDIAPPSCYCSYNCSSAEGPTSCAIGYCERGICQQMCNTVGPRASKVGACGGADGTTCTCVSDCPGKPPSSVSTLRNKTFEISNGFI